LARREAKGEVTMGERPERKNTPLNLIASGSHLKKEAWSLIWGGTGEIAKEAS